MEDISDTLERIARNLENICIEISELRSDMQLIGTTVLIDMLAKDRPDLRKKMAPLTDEWIKGLEVTLSELDEESLSGLDDDKSRM